LDAAVGGCMVFAKTPAAAAGLSVQIRERTMQKEYLAVIRGKPEENAGRLEDLLFRDAARNKSYVVKRARRGVRAAALSFRLLETAGEGALMRSLLQVLLHTGRTHQIRVQFASRGMPLAGDGKYGGGRDGAMGLWSWRLAFSHPESGTRLELRCLPPASPPWTAFPQLAKSDKNAIAPLEEIHITEKNRDQTKKSDKSVQIPLQKR